MAFFKQVAALMRKDFEVAKASKKGTICETLLPVLCGVFAGLFIVLIGIIQDLFGSEFENLNSLDDPQWQGWIGAAPSASLIAMGQVGAAMSTNGTTIGKLFNHLTTDPSITYGVNTSYYYPNGMELDLTNGYFQAQLLNSSTKLMFIGLAVNAMQNWTIYAGARPQSENLVAMVMTMAHMVYDPAFAINQGMLYVQKKLTHKPIRFMMNFKAMFSSSAVSFLLNGFIPSLILTGGRMVDEKKNKVRESLKVMGVSDTAYLVASFASAFCRMGIGTTLISVVLAAFLAIEPHQIPIVLGICCLFAVSLISYAQIMPSLFSQSLWSNVLVILFMWGGANLSALSTIWPEEAQRVLCLISPIAFFYSLLPELAGGGAMELKLPQRYAIGMLAVDTVLYLLIGNYIYAVNPGEFGVPKHPLFFIGCGRRKKIGEDRDEEHDTREEKAEDTARISPQDRVVLRRLFKRYPNAPKDVDPAVDGLTLGIRSGEIFALLGHNGAGKTTTISILTGMVDASDYHQATVDGLDVHTQMDEIRQSIGLCPQFDVLFNDLSARQHLELFAGIKTDAESDPEVVQKRINYLLEELELTDDTKPAGKFSGGMKRRLSVGNALVGDASLVFLDEPSSGMDPLNRRRMWNLLKSERDSGKTIVLTTHFMEEADYLGDRIAIMSHGRLYCCDTSQQLKEQHGVGFYLTLVKRESSEKDSTNAPARTADVAGAQILICCHIPDVKLHHESSGDVTFMLPTSALSQFGDMLKALEEKLPSLGFHSYGVAMNTLEDVFVSISKKEEDDRKRAKHDAEKQKKLAKQQSRDPGDSPQLRQVDSVASSPTRNRSLANIGLADDTDIENGTKNLDTDTIWGTPAEFYWQQGLRVPHRQRVMYHAKVTFIRKVRLLMYSRKMQLMTLLFPIVFIVLPFFVLQPQPRDIVAVGSSILPPFEDLYLVSIDPRNRGYNDRIRDMFTTLYYRQYPRSQLTWLKCQSYDCFTSGEFIPLKLMNFFQPFEQPPIPGAFIFHDIDLAATPRPYANYTMMWSERYMAAATAQFIAVFDAAVEVVAREVMAANSSSAPQNNGISNFTLNIINEIELVVTPNFFPSNPNETATTVTQQGAEDEDDREVKYQFVGVGIYTMISVVQVVANCVLPVADEFHRGIYHTLRVHGMTASGYFLGNLAFDILTMIYPWTLFAGAAYIKGVGAFYSSIAVWVVLCGFILGCNVICQAYILASKAQMKPVMFTAMLHAINLALMGGPYMSTLGLTAAEWDTFDNQIRPILLAVTPQSAWYYLLDHTSDMTYSTTRPGYVISFYGTMGAWAFMSVWLWMLVPIYVLWGIITDNSTGRRLRPENIKEAKKNAIKKHKKHLGNDDAGSDNSGSKKEDTVKYVASPLAPQKRHALNRAEDSADEKSIPLLAVPEAKNVSIVGGKAIGHKAQGDDDDDSVLDGIPLDVDVLREAARVNNPKAKESGENLIAVRKLMKCFRTKKGYKAAVNETSFGIKRGECFGLLGPNGAGKTTTCKTILKEMAPDAGEVDFSAYANLDESNETKDEQFLKLRLGLCSQSDTLWEHLSAEDHLHHYLQLRLTTEYKRELFDTYVKNAIEKVQLEEAGKKVAGGFSGGMKRKLAVCLAMYTGAVAVLLDEPSTGMDPFARRALWRVILEALSNDRAVLLTTHSMEEADAVCARIAIMTAGVMRCIGSSQHLKNRFGSGYVVSLTCRPEIDFAKLDQKVIQFFGPGTELKEALGTQRKYAVGALPSLAKAFSEIEQRRNDWGLTQYAISQTSSLEQIFLNFVGATDGDESDDEEEEKDAKANDAKTKSSAHDPLQDDTL